MFFLITQFGFTQIQSVDYSLRYNSETCLFDCYLIVNEGKTKTTVSRAQFNSQVSIVVPVSSNVFVEESYMPLRDNQSFRSSEPVSWEITNELEQPTDLNESRLVSISPVLAPTAFYNDIKAGDEIRLFSLKVNPITNCGEGVRLFDNQKDPKSIADGMMGADFSNGFTIGGVGQKYAGNALSESPIPPSFVYVSTKNRTGVNFEAQSVKGSACQSDLTYEVFGPNGRIGSMEDYYKHINKNQDRGEYRVVATDAIGCKAEHKFYPFGKSKSDLAITRNENSEVLTSFASSIYPNPSQDVVNLTVSGKAGTQVDADIFDLDGKLVKSAVAELQLNGSEQSIKINTGLAPGVYNLALNIDKNDVVNHRLIIVK